MKKQLLYLYKNENGSMFIYLFYLSLITLLLTFTMINQFANEQSLSNLEIEALQLNMIHQQTYQTVMSQWDEIDFSQTLHFQFPNGETSVLFTRKSEEQVNMTITAYRGDQYRKTKVYQLSIPNEQKDTEI